MAEINIEKMAQSVAKKAVQELRDDGVFISRWIPVSERLPEGVGECLVTVKLGYVRTALWTGDVEYWNEVTAWMPLPKPYEPQESEMQE